MRTLILSLAVFSLLIFSTRSTLAFEVLDPACSSGTASAAQSPACQANTAHKSDPVNPVVRTIKDLAKFIALLSGIVAVFMIMYSGLRYIMSGSNPESQKIARSTLSSAVIGLLVIASAWVIVSTVIKLTTG